MLTQRLLMDFATRHMNAFPWIFFWEIQPSLLPPILSFFFRVSFFYHSFLLSSPLFLPSWFQTSSYYTYTESLRVVKQVSLLASLHRKWFMAQNWVCPHLSCVLLHFVVPMFGVHEVSWVSVYWSTPPSDIFLVNAGIWSGSPALYIRCQRNMLGSVVCLSWCSCAEWTYTSFVTTYQKEKELLFRITRSQTGSR